MRNPFQSGAETSSFLPEDYVTKQHDHRTNVIGLTLFFIVIAGVLGAFFVTNQRWNDVKAQQEAINAEYQEAAMEIEQLKELEAQKVEMIARATLTASLKERAPRSIVLAELLNRMPVNVALTSVELEANKITRRRPAPKTTTTAKTKSLAKKGAKAEEEESRPQPPSYRTTISIVGVATTHNDVASYVAALRSCPLLAQVEIRFSEITLQDDRELNKFRIEASLDPSADARRIEPLTLTQARKMGIGLDLNDRRDGLSPVADADEEN